MNLFEEETVRVLELLRSGTSVALVGMIGSGRSEVVRAVVTELERTGASVEHVRGHAGLRKVPLAALRSLDLDVVQRTGGRPLDLLDVADALSRRLTASSQPVLVVDDLETVDPESLTVVDIARERTGTPLLAAKRPRTMHDTDQVLTLPPDQVRIELGALRYDDVSALLGATLDGPVDSGTVVRVLTYTAGNPRLVVSVALTAARDGLLTRYADGWRISAPDLWSPSSCGVVESLLHGLDRPARDAALLLAGLGTQPLDTVLDVIAPSGLEPLEERGLLAFVEEPDGRTTATVTPPVLVDCLTYRRSEVPRAWARAVLAPHGVTPTSDLRSAPRRDGSRQDAALARYHEVQADVLGNARWAQWEEEPTVANAEAYLSAVWEASPDARRVEEVFRATVVPPDATDVVVLTRYLTLEAQWDGYVRRNLSGALARLRGYAHDRPEIAPELVAYDLLLQAAIGPVPDGFVELLGPYVEPDAPRALPVRVLAYLHTLALEPAAAQRVLETQTPASRFSEDYDLFRDGLLSLVRGRWTEIATVATEAWAQSRRDLNRLGQSVAGYVASLALFVTGRWNEAESIMHSVFVLGRPSGLMSPLHAGMLRLSGLVAACEGRVDVAESLVAHADRPHTPDGPGPTTARAFSDVVRGVVDKDAPQVTAAFAAVADERRGRGLAATELLELLLQLVVLPDAAGVRRFGRLVESHELDELVPLAHLATVLVVDDGLPTDDEVAALLSSDQRFVAACLVGHAARAARAADGARTDGVRADALDEILTQFGPGSGPHALDVARREASPSLLTDRETEVALLATTLRNVEIAERLGVSVRTVENHVSNGMRKSGARNRDDLSQVAARRAR